MKSSAAQAWASDDLGEECLADHTLEQKHADARDRCQRRLGINSASVNLLVQDFMASHSVTVYAPGYAVRSSQYHLQ
jgi:hypothetical protein